MGNYLIVQGPAHTDKVMTMYGRFVGRDTPMMNVSQK